MNDPLMAHALVLPVLIALAVAAAILLQRARTPGWAMIGGVLAGILLGPTIFGRIAPETYERLLVGGIEQREAIERKQRQQAVDILAAIETGVDREQIEQLRQEHEIALEPYAEALALARADHQQPFRWFVAASIALTMLAGAQWRIPPPAQARSWGSALNIGVWAAALPGALAFLAMQWFWGHDQPTAALVAAAVMIGPWAVMGIDQHAADQAEFGGGWMIQTSGRLATLLALGTLGWAVWAAAGAEGLLWATTLLALPIGWTIMPVLSTLATGRGAASGHTRDHHQHTTMSNGTAPNGTAPIGPRGRPRRWGRTVTQRVLLPVLAACVSVQIELIEHFAFWPLLVLLILSGDGRWAGAVIGALLIGGRSGLRTMRLVLGSMACGPTQLAVLALLMALDVLPNEWPLAILAGAILIEASAPLRRSLADRLAEAEVIVDESGDGEP